ncbi:Phage tail tube protein, TTP [Nitrosospira sp. Nl5]|uniref:phage tail tube protein n=1 Tax=Nitrosospira sp. Nl5 TaxID=200120 RepID=UPI0008877110|nr:phage tail tube protein [Nitrosospira sp. Nl5]SCX94192.1 Phage tail tube protein, TTP [Nitrosospira sp. Nl5]
MAFTNSGLVLALQSAIAAAITVTGVTNDAPGIHTATAHGLSDGAFVLAEYQGMVEANMRIFEIVNKDVNTFQFKDTTTGSNGIDTTDWGVFSTGTVKLITFGTTLSGVTGFTPSGGEIKKVDSTEVSDLVDKETVVGATAMSYNMTMKWDPSAAAQIAMREAFEQREARAFKIKWPGGQYAVFYGTVGYSGMPGGDNQGLTTTQAAVSMEGAPTYGKP